MKENKRGTVVRDSLYAAKRIAAYVGPLALPYIAAVLVWGSQDFVIPYLLAKLQSDLTGCITGTAETGFFRAAGLFFALFTAYMLLFCIAAYGVMMVQEHTKVSLWKACCQRLLHAVSPMREEEAFIRFSGDVGNAAISTLGTAGSVVQGAVALAGSLAVVLSVHPVLAVSAVLLGVCNILIKRRFMPRFREIGSEMRTGEAALQADLNDNIANKIAVRLFNLMGIREREFAARLDRLTAVNGKSVALDTRYAVLDYCRRWMTYGGILVIGGLLIADGRITLAELMLAVGVLPQVTVKMGFLIDIVVSYQSAYPSCLRTIGILDLPQEPEACDRGADGGVSHAAPERLVMENVSFSYPGEEAHGLRDISLTVRRGEKIALTGASGSGKSTLLKLAAGLILPENGRAEMDGTPLTAGNAAAWRARTAWADQQSLLFPGSLRENLLIGNREADAAALHRVLEDAQAQDVAAEREEGLGAQAAGDESTLSGGQRQRIALARALLRDNAVLCLDEITSAQDPERREKLGRFLTEEDNGLTVIAATNDPLFAACFPREVRMRDGRIVCDTVRQE